MLVHKNYPPLSWGYFKHFSISNFGAFYYPLFVGSVVLGLMCAVVLYFIAWIVADRWERKQHLGE
jgi:uncharacterized protein (DUF2062 family)